MTSMSLLGKALREKRRSYRLGVDVLLKKCAEIHHDPGMNALVTGCAGTWMLHDSGMDALVTRCIGT